MIDIQYYDNLGAAGGINLAVKSVSVIGKNAHLLLGVFVIVLLLSNRLADAIVIMTSLFYGEFIITTLSSPKTKTRTKSSLYILLVMYTGIGIIVSAVIFSMIPAYNILDEGKLLVLGMSFLVISLVITLKKYH